MGLMSRCDYRNLIFSSSALCSALDAHSHLGYNAYYQKMLRFSALTPAASARAGAAGRK
jgi:hypothetical protein